MTKIRYEFLTRSGGSYWWAGKDQQQGETVICSVPVTQFWPHDQYLDEDLVWAQARLLQQVVGKIKDLDSKDRERPDEA